MSDEKDRNLQYQKELSQRLLRQMDAVFTLLTKAMNIHLNVEQQFTIDTPNLFMSLETLKGESLMGKEIQLVGKARLRLPSTGNLSLNQQQPGSLRVRSSFNRLFHIICRSLSLSLSAVNSGTFAFVWFCIEYRSFSVDFLDLDESTRK